MNAITPFQFETTPLRTIMRDGNPWFVAADICAALEIQNPSQAVARLDADERSMSNIGRQGDALIVNESGLFTLILRCRDAVTPGTIPHRFRRWVTSEVLPALHRDGYYGAPPPDPMKALADPATLRTMLLGYSERVLELEARTEAQAGAIAVLAPQAAALERIAIADEGSMSITAAAKALQLGPRELHEWMRANGWTYRRPGGELLGHQSRVDRGLIEHKVGTADHPGGRTHAYRQVLVTPKGLTKLAAIFGRREAA